MCWYVLLIFAETPMYSTLSIQKFKNLAKLDGILRFGWYSQIWIEFWQLDGILRIRWNFANSMEFQGLDGILQTGWKTEFSIRFLEFHPVVWIPSMFENSIHFVEFHRVRKIPSSWIEFHRVCEIPSSRQNSIVWLRIPSTFVRFCSRNDPNITVEASTGTPRPAGPS